MSNANTVSYAYKKEVTFGTNPGGNFQKIRSMGESLKPITEAVNSDELGSRRVTDVQRIDYKAGGDFRGRFSYKNADDWIVAAMMSDQADAGTTAVTHTLSATSTLQAVAAGNVLRVAGAAKIAWSTIADGRWIRVKGFAGGAGNPTEFYCRKVSHTGDDATVDNITLVNEAAISTGEVEAGTEWKDGSTERSFSVERNYGTSLASNFTLYAGLEFNTFSFAVGAKALAELTFGCTAKTDTFFASTQAGTPVAAPTNRLIQGVDHISAVLNDGTAVGYFDFRLQLNNNLRERNEFGVLGPKSIGAGQFNVSVDLNRYHDGDTQLAKYRAFTDTSLAIKIRDAHGNAYVVCLPSGNFGDGSAFAEANNTDVRQPLTFMSKESSTFGCQMQFTRWDV